jgi:hypothetical protein
VAFKSRSASARSALRSRAPPRCVQGSRAAAGCSGHTGTPQLARASPWRGLRCDRAEAEGPRRVCPGCPTLTACRLPRQGPPIHRRATPWLGISQGPGAIGSRHGLGLGGDHNAQHRLWAVQNLDAVSGRSQDQTWPPTLRSYEDLFKISPDQHAATHTSASEMGQQETPALQKQDCGILPFDAGKVGVVFSESCRRDVPKSFAINGRVGAIGRRKSRKLN